MSAGGVTIWRLERLRLTRTRRGLALLATFLFFGLTSPLVTRYAADIVRRFGGGVEVKLPPATPQAALADYLKNAQQIGLLVAVAVAAGALAFDAHPEAAAFLRTRVRRVGDLVVPKATVSWVAIGAAFVAGTVAAWYETVVLLGALPAGRMILGMAFEVAYLWFAVAVTALCAGVARSVAVTAVLALVTLAGIGVLGLLPVIEPWLPSHLAGAPDAIVGGASAAGYIRAAAVAVASGGACLAGSIRLLGRREL